MFTLRYRKEKKCSAMNVKKKVMSFFSKSFTSISVRKTIVLLVKVVPVNAGKYVSFLLILNSTKHLQLVSKLLKLITLLQNQALMNKY